MYITYSLKEEEINSNHFYQEVETFTEIVLTKANSKLHHIIQQYRDYQIDSRQSKVDPEEACTLELLTMGVLWRVYSINAKHVNEFASNVLVMLSKVRSQNQNFRTGTDSIKGAISTLFLSSDNYNENTILKPRIEHLYKLILWLEATEEFLQEAKLLKKWHFYLSMKTDEESENIIRGALRFASWFEKESIDALGSYTKNVEQYLDKIYPTRQWQEDVIFCGRRRVEYHLNMVGAIIMNQIYREDFVKAKHKYVILPACMRLHTEHCQAKSTERGIECAGCSVDCEVSHITEICKKHGVDVILVYHESTITTNSLKILEEDNIGIVGVACVLKLISGGWTLEEKGIPAQCVILEYCGCKKHWHHQGIPTSINLEKLKELIS